MSEVQFNDKKDNDNNPTLDLSRKKTIMAEGKTKTIFFHDDSEIPYKHLVKIVTKNSLTAFDGAKEVEANVAKDKTEQTCNVFELLNRKDIPTSFIKKLDDTSFIAKTCTMLPYEIVLRRYAWGSYLKRYPKVNPATRLYSPVLEKFFKLAIVPPVRAHEDLHAIVPETTMMEEHRARKYYMKDGKWTVPVETDPFIRFNYYEWNKLSQDPLRKEGFMLDFYASHKPFNESERIWQIPSSITPKEFSDILYLANRCFSVLEKEWSRFDINLVDLKIEIGIDYNTGEFLVADVIDNDSWRLWPKGDPKKQLDKQSFRDGEDISSVEAKYNEVTYYTSKF